MLPPLNNQTSRECDTVIDVPNRWDGLESHCSISRKYVVDIQWSIQWNFASQGIHRLESKFQKSLSCVFVALIKAMQAVMPWVPLQRQSHE